jgi:hypothetical protein
MMGRTESDDVVKSGIFDDSEIFLGIISSVKNNAVKLQIKVQLIQFF